MRRDYFKTCLYNLLDAMPYCIFIKDKELRFSVCNERFLKNAGFNNYDDIKGKSDFEMPWSREQSNLYRNDDLTIIKTGKPKLNYLEFQRTEKGEEVINLVSKWPIEDADHRIIGILCVYSNLTDTHPLITNAGTQKDRTFSLCMDNSKINFTRLETKMLYHLIRGKSAKAIAIELKISTRTVEGYIENIKAKMMVSKKSEIIEKIINIILGVK